MDLTLVWFLTITLVIQEHQAYPCTRLGPMVEEGLSTQLAHRALRREKRCSCENPRDKECVYFCHVGILWVNTPRWGHVVSYGVGSLRLKRGLERCVCTNRRDKECLHYCSASQRREKLFSQDTDVHTTEETQGIMGNK